MACMVNSVAPLSSDDAYERLHSTGWSVGEVCYTKNGGDVWLVYAHQGEQKIVAKAPTQTAAWRRACTMAAEIESQ